MAEGGRRKSYPIFKKSSPNNKITLYIARREMVLAPNRVEKVEGIVLIDNDYAWNRNLFAQIMISTRYGRDDDESLGVYLYCESVVTTAKIWPVCDEECISVSLTAMKALARRLGPNATAFHLDLPCTGPPTMTLWSHQPYIGAPLGVHYDVRVFLAEGPEDVVSKRNMVRMGIRVIQSSAAIDHVPLVPPETRKAYENSEMRLKYERFKIRPRPRNIVEVDSADESGHTENEMIEEYAGFEDPANKKDEEMGPGGSRNNAEAVQGKEVALPAAAAVAAALGPRPAPRLIIEKRFFPSVRKLRLEAWLDKSSYHHGDKVHIHFRIRNNSKKTIRRIEAKLVQILQICLYGGRSYKNVVAMIAYETAVSPRTALQNFVTLAPRRTITTNWLAVDDTVDNADDCLAATVMCTAEPPKGSMIALYVSYYAKITLRMDKCAGKVAIKLPFSISPVTIPEAPAVSVPEESAKGPYVEEGVYAAEGEEKEADEDANEDDIYNEVFYSNTQGINQTPEIYSDRNVYESDDVEEDTKDKGEGNVNNAAIANKLTQAKAHTKEGRQGVSAGVYQHEYGRSLTVPAAPY